MGNQIAQSLIQSYAASFGASSSDSTTAPLTIHSRHATSLAAHASEAQTKRSVNALGDSYEREAESVSDQIMRMPEPKLQRACASGGGCDKCQVEQGHEHESKQMRRASSDDVSQTAALPIVHEVLRSPGQLLGPTIRAFMEPRFGYDFSRVHVHTDWLAGRAAEALAAHAYTVGSDIVFGPGRYAPANRDARRLLAHELAHVVQQSGDSQQRHLQRQSMQPTDVPASAVIRDAPNAKTWTGAPPECGPDFCRPLPSEGMAIDSLTHLWPIFAVGIAIKVSTKVVPLWAKWAFGGSSSIMDLTKDFGTDFTASPTTAKTTQFLMDRIKSKLTSSPPSMPVTGTSKLDIPTLIPADVKAIDDPSSPNQMNFNVIGDIPGNIAGGIGKDQAATPIGKNPSPQDDMRIAKGDVTILDGGGTNLAVIPRLNYTVKDTIDFCPGNCGASLEQKATIPMSQWEATGISGDVPFTVDFPAPLLQTLPFTIPKPAVPKAPPPVPAAAPKGP